MMKLLLVSICLASALVGGHQHFGCGFDDNQLISEVTSTIGTDYSYRHGNSLTDWGIGEAKVPYFFAEGIHEEDKAVVRKEMERITEHVPCITFEDTSQTNVPVPLHHLEIQVGNERGCYEEKEEKDQIITTSQYFTFAGVVNWGGKLGEKVSLNSTYRLANTAWCAEKETITGGVLHELMHVLGIAHTQKRFDRDNHIEVNKTCIIPDENDSNLHQYEKTKEGDLNNYGVPYKCNSIMHYSDDTLALNKQCKTMKPISDSCKKTGIGSNVAIEEDWQLLKKAHCER